MSLCVDYELSEGGKKDSGSVVWFLGRYVCMQTVLAGCLRGRCTSSSRWWPHDGVWKFAGDSDKKLVVAMVYLTLMKRGRTLVLVTELF